MKKINIEAAIGVQKTLWYTFCSGLQNQIQIYWSIYLSTFLYTLDELSFYLFSDSFPKEIWEQPEWIKFAFIAEQIRNSKTKLDSSYVYLFRMDGSLRRVIPRPCWLWTRKCRLGLDQLYSLIKKDQRWHHHFGQVHGEWFLEFQLNPLTTNVPHHIETSQSICNAIQLTGFYMMGNIGR